MMSGAMASMRGTTDYAHWLVFFNLFFAYRDAFVCISTGYS